MIAPAGSIPWLLLHEIRLGWRETLGGRGARIGLVVAGLLFLCLLGLGVPLGMALRDFEIEIRPEVILTADVVMAVLFTLMLSQTLAGATQALYTRGDLDLLFSSPLLPRTTLTVRFAALALNAVALFAILAAGLLIPIAFLGHPEWLGALAVLISLSLAASALALVLSILLFRLLGPRRTRTVAQVLAALSGAALFLPSQFGNLLSDGPRRTFFDGVVTFIQRQDIVIPPGADLPLRAMVGQPGPLAAIVGASLALFLAANHLLGERFSRDTAAAIGSDAMPKLRRGGDRPFADGAFAATLRKELRLLTRDPALLSQVLLRALYLVPLAFVLLRAADRGEAGLLPGGAAALVVLTGQVSSSLAWITVSGEDAPDLLVAGPTPVRLLNRAKLSAALIPVGLMLAIPLIGLVVLAPVIGLTAIAGCMASAVAAALINVWHQRPGRRGDFRRRGNVRWIFGLAILLISSLIGLTTYLASELQIWTVLPAALAVLVTLALRKSDRAIVDTLRGGR